MKEKLKESWVLVEVSVGCLVMILVLGVPVIIGIKLLTTLLQWLF